MGLSHLPWLHRWKWGFKARLSRALPYPTRPCLARSRCSGNVWRKDQCHWTLPGHLLIRTDPGLQKAWTRPPTHATPGWGHQLQGAAAAAPPSRQHVDLKPTPPAGSCPSSAIGRGRPHLRPIGWPLPESELGIRPSAVSFRAARDVSGVWHPRLFSVLTGLKGAAGEETDAGVASEALFKVTFKLF